MTDMAGGKMKVRIGTRGSDLALWQANHIASRLAPVAETEIIVIKTRGDAIDTKPLQEVEGKAFFTAEIEQALLDESVDLAVHSHKDLATESPPGLVIIAVPERGPPGEILLVREEAHDPEAPLLPLVHGARVGTSAPRRRSQLKTLRADLRVEDLRGNVPTRVRRCQEGKYDAVVLAEAGVYRLELDTAGLVREPLSLDHFVPAPAQGALAIQIRAADEALAEICMAHLHDPTTEAHVRAERVLLQELGGGCHMPLGVHLDHTSGGFRARAFLGAGCPEEADRPRWAEATGATPDEAAERVHARLLTQEPTEYGPLSGLRIGLVGSSNDSSVLGDRLKELGAEVEHEQVLSFEDVGAPDLPARLARLEAGDVLAVTSQEAARRLKGERVPSGVLVAAVGPATAKALAAVGIRPGFVGTGGAELLAETLPIEPGHKVLFPCAEQARKDLPAVLEGRGIVVDRVVLYRSTSHSEGDACVDLDARVYMSPSAVAASVVLGREGDLGQAVRVGLGGSTCDALQDEGLGFERPDGSGPEAALNKIADLLGRRSVQET
jgi:hydroxymethylbilane synthase